MFIPTTISEPRNKVTRNIIKALNDIGPIKLYGAGRRNANSKTGINLNDIAPYLFAISFKYHHQYRSYGLHNSYATVPCLIEDIISPS